MDRENDQPYEIPVDYDNHWKEIIKYLFEDFIKFFLSEAHPLIDFTRPAIFLEQELSKIVGDNSKKGKAVNDKLVKVFLKDGSEKWILIHIEVQSSYKKSFTNRMFTYFYRIYDQYSKDMTAIAIYRGERIPKNYSSFDYNFLGTTVKYQFNAYLVKEAKTDELLKSQNPFALAVLATKYLYKTKRDAKQKLVFKKKLMRLMLEKDYKKEQISRLFTFINLVLELPRYLEHLFIKDVTENLIKSADMQNHETTPVGGHLFNELFGEIKKEYDRKLEAKGIEKGIEKTIENALKMEKYTVAEIAQIANVSIEFVEEIKAKIT